MASPRGTAPLALAVSLALVAGCGGGGKKATLGPPSSEVSSTTEVAASTSTTVDPGLKDLLLVAADVPSFKEDTAAPDPSAKGDDPLTTCAADLPDLKALVDVPSTDGATFTRGAPLPVTVTSSAASADPQVAEAGLNALLTDKATQCFATTSAASQEAAAGAGAKATGKTTATKATLPGVDQTVLLSTLVTVTAGGKPMIVRIDFAFLRREGIAVAVLYTGPATLATVAERQRLVGIVGKRLAGPTSGTTGTSGSSTSVTGGGSSTTKRSTTTTRRSGSSTSSTTKASTTSSSIK